MSASPEVPPTRQPRVLSFRDGLVWEHTEGGDFLAAQSYRFKAEDDLAVRLRQRMEKMLNG